MSGGVDPPPPPFECTPDVRAGRRLDVQAAQRAAELLVEIQAQGAAWRAVAITDVVGGAARPVHAAGPRVEFVIELAAPDVASGSFKVTGTLDDPTAGGCPVSRTFTFTLAAGRVVIADASELPLAERSPARIVLVGREGREVELAVRLPEGRSAEVAWTVSGGQILAADRSRLRWRLPAKAGVYQAEAVVDYGEAGFSFDALALELG
jgi:hypothetical protein